MINASALKNDSKHKIITGDCIARIWTKTKEDFISMEAFGIGERHERGDRLIECAYKLIIENTLFQIGKNDIGDEQKISEAENIKKKKKKNFRYQHTKAPRHEREIWN